MSKTTRLAALLGREALQDNRAEASAERLALERERLRAQTLRDALTQLTQGTAQAIGAGGQAIGGLVELDQQRKDLARKRAFEELQASAIANSGELTEAPTAASAQAADAESQAFNTSLETDLALGELGNKQLKRGSPIRSPQERMSLDVPKLTKPNAPKVSLSPASGMKNTYENLRRDPRFRTLSDDQIRAALVSQQQNMKNMGLNQKLQEARINKANASGQLTLKQKTDQLRALGPGFIQRVRSITAGKSPDEQAQMISHVIARSSGITDPNEAASIFYTLEREARQAAVEDALKFRELNPTKEKTPDSVSDKLTTSRDVVQTYERLSDYMVEKKEKIQFGKLARMNKLANEIGLPSIPSNSNMKGDQISFGASIAGTGAQGGKGESEASALGSYAVGDERAVQLQNELMGMNAETREYVSRLQMLNRQVARAVEKGLLTNVDWTFYQAYLANPFSNDPAVTESRLNSLYNEVAGQYADRISEYSYKYDLAPIHDDWAERYASNDEQRFNITGRRKTWKQQLTPEISVTGGAKFNEKRKVKSRPPADGADGPPDDDDEPRRPGPRGDPRRPGALDAAGIGYAQNAINELLREEGFKHLVPDAIKVKRDIKTRKISPLEGMKKIDKIMAPLRGERKPPKEDSWLPDWLGSKAVGDAKQGFRTAYANVFQNPDPRNFPAPVQRKGDQRDERVTYTKQGEQPRQILSSEVPTVGRELLQQGFKLQRTPAPSGSAIVRRDGPTEPVGLSDSGGLAKTAAPTTVPRVEDVARKPVDVDGVMDIIQEKQTYVHPDGMEITVSAEQARSPEFMRNYIKAGYRLKRDPKFSGRRRTRGSRGPER